MPRPYVFLEQNAQLNYDSRDAVPSNGFHRSPKRGKKDCIEVTSDVGSCSKMTVCRCARATYPAWDVEDVAGTAKWCCLSDMNGLKLSQTQAVEQEKHSWHAEKIDVPHLLRSRTQLE